MFVCIDREPGLLDLDFVVGEEAVGETAWFWEPGTVLSVRFLDGDADLRDRVMAAARDWTDHANLTFRVVEDGPADIRVTFAGTGNWSAVGTMSKLRTMFPPDAPTMCLSEAPLVSPERLGGLARHEFGHAIGMVHEHSSPASGIAWNRGAVLTELGGPPNYWSPADVAENVFDKYDETRTQFTEFDPRSVMLYAFPPEWTLDGTTFPFNSELSDADKAFVAKVYPGAVPAAA